MGRYASDEEIQKIFRELYEDLKLDAERTGDKQMARAGRRLLRVAEILVLSIHHLASRE